MSIPLDEHGQPNLQMLIEQCGGYDKITNEIWEAWVRANNEWQERRRDRSAAPSSEIRNLDRADPDRLCVCGLPGVFWRPRKSGGRAIWRCEQHHDLWPDYADGIPQAAE